MGILDKANMAIVVLNEELDYLRVTILDAMTRKDEAVLQEGEMRKAYDQREGYIAELEDLVAKERAKTKALKEALNANLAGILAEDD